MGIKFFIFFIIVQVASNAAFGQSNTSSFSADFKTTKIPFVKLMHLNHEELLDLDFKYNKKNNLYYVEHISRTTKINRIISVTNVNSPEDFSIVIRMKDDEQAIVEVYFYSFFMYEAIETWIYDNIKDIYEIGNNSNKLFEFSRDSLDFRLMKESKLKYHSLNEFKLTDQMLKWDHVIYAQGGFDHKMSGKKFFSVYSFKIFSGLMPNSPWLEKKEQKALMKKEKRKAKRAKRK